jgi:hypothetical protein
MLYKYYGYNGIKFGQEVQFDFQINFIESLTSECITHLLPNSLKYFFFRLFIIFNRKSVAIMVLFPPFLELLEVSQINKLIIFLMFLPFFY